MNLEEIVTTALSDHVSGLEPSPGAWDAIRGRSRRRRLLPPLVGLAAVLTVVAGLLVVLRDTPRPGPVVVAAPARTPADLYLEGIGSIWPLNSKAEADAWRREPESAPYLRDAVETAKAFAGQVLGLSRVEGTTERFEGELDVVEFTIEGTDILIGVARPDRRGPWVVAVVGPDGETGWARHWKPEGDRKITSPVEIAVPYDAIPRVVADVAEVVGGRHRVLGAFEAETRQSNRVTYVPVEFQPPSGGFGVIRVVGYDEDGRVVRAHMLPASFLDPWPRPEGVG